VSQSFEMRVLDLQTELKRRDEESAAATVDTETSKKYTNKSAKRGAQKPGQAALWIIL